MTIPGLIGIDIYEYCTMMQDDGFVLIGAEVQWVKAGWLGAILRVKPAHGYEFVYDEATDSFHATEKLDKPVRYIIEFKATTRAAIKEVDSLLNAISRHTTTFQDFRKEVA